jgi:transposase
MEDNIIKLLNFEDSDLEVVSLVTNRNQRILTIRKKPVPHYCEICGFRMYSKGIYERTVNHPILQDGMPLILKVQQRRWQCTNKACRHVVTDKFSFVKKYKHNSSVTDLMVLDAFRDSKLNASQIAEKFNVSDTYALETFSKYVDMHRRQLGEAVCIDEVHVHVSKVCNYALVIQDFATGEPIDMIASRRQEFTEPYFASIPFAERAKVKYLISDMYRPYIGYVDKYFPNAVSVVDSFHVIKHINNQLRNYMRALARRLRNEDELRHKEKEDRLHREIKFVPSREYYLVKNFQWVILSNQDNLEYNKSLGYNYKLRQYIDLHGVEYYLFNIDPNLKELRRLKENYIRFNNTYGDNPKKARVALHQLIHEYRYSGFKTFKEIADTLDYHFESIINSFVVMERYCADGTHISRLSNGPMESLNRIAKDLKRNARGFRNFEHLRNRFLFAERKNAQILAVPRPPEEYRVNTGGKRGPYKNKKPE